MIGQQPIQCSHAAMKSSDYSEQSIAFQQRHEVRDRQQSLNQSQEAIFVINYWIASSDPTAIDKSTFISTHRSVISNTLEYTTDKSGQKSLTFKRSTIASPETSTHNSCCHSHATVVPSQAYSPHSGENYMSTGRLIAHQRNAIRKIIQSSQLVVANSNRSRPPKQVINPITFLSGFRTSNRITEVLYYVNRNQLSRSLSAASNSSSGYSSRINLHRTESALTEHTQASST